MTRRRKRVVTRSNLYRVGSAWGLLHALERGPSGVFRFVFRRGALRTLFRVLRAFGV